MKVGLVLERFDPARGGLENWSWQFARFLIQTGMQVHVICCGHENSPSECGLVFHTVPENRSPLRRAAAFETKIKTLTLDVVHDMGCGWHADIFHPHGGSTRAWREHNLMRIPRWRQFRLWQERRYREQAEVERRQHAFQASTIIAVSHMVKTHLLQWHGLPEERIRVIPNGVNTEWFSPRNADRLRDSTRQAHGFFPQETVFLLVAHNLLLKNAEAAIRAMQPLVRDGRPVRLVIVGGRRVKPFLRLCDRLGVREKVMFLDACTDMRPLYAMADGLVHPTWYDPCSLVVLEALASGLPVITTRYNGACERMQAAESGFLLEDPADVKTLASHLRSLCSPTLREKMGLAACQAVQEATLMQQTAAFLDLYEGIVRRKTSLSG